MKFRNQRRSPESSRSPKGEPSSGLFFLEGTNKKATVDLEDVVDPQKALNIHQMNVWIVQNHHSMTYEQ